jgi:Ca2+-binding EF-hand superfamily protein
MLSSSIPDYQESNRGLNSKFDTFDKDMLLNREVTRLIENLKQGKTNDSDLNQRLNLKPNGGKATQHHFARAATKPKLKRAVSVVNGSVSYLISGGNKKLTMLKDKEDLEDELFGFKKEELDHNFQFGFSESPYGHDFEKDRHTKVILTKEEKKKIATGADNKLRLRTVQYLVETNEQVIHKLKVNYKILANWLNYVGYLSRPEFYSALKSIGISHDKRLYEKLFWLFDMNGDGIIDEKEFVLINNLFKGHTVEEKAKIFFALCDQENDGFLDEGKLKIFFKKKVMTEDWRLEDSKNDATKQTNLLVA